MSKQAAGCMATRWKRAHMHDAALRQACACRQAACGKLYRRAPRKDLIRMQLHAWTPNQKAKVAALRCFVAACVHASHPRRCCKGTAASSRRACRQFPSLRLLSRQH